jgi:hypothetical protein
VFVFYTLPSLVRVPSVVFSQSVSQHPAARQAFCGCAGEENTLNRALSSGPRGVQGLQWVRTGLSDHLRGLQLGQRALGTQAGGGGGARWTPHHTPNTAHYIMPVEARVVSRVAFSGVHGRFESNLFCKPCRSYAYNLVSIAPTSDHWVRSWLVTAPLGHRR